MTLTQNELRQMGEVVAGWRRPLLITHARPDGDALGCLIVMRSILRRIGAAPLAVTVDPVPTKYAMLIEDEPLGLWGETVEPSDLAKVDGVLLMDACTYDQLGAISDWFRRAKCPKTAVDHHLTRDELADAYLVDESAAAACEILYEWSQACDWPMDDAARRAIFVGIATDTGWFRFANTGARSLEIAAALVREGVVPDTLFRQLYESDSAARVRLFGAAIEAMELYRGDQIAVMSLSRETFARSRATSADTEDVVNTALRIATVEVAVLVSESDDGVIKLSFRSKGRVDVAAVAGRFGGGGHSRAAGARVKGTPAKIVEEVVSAIVAQGI